MGYVAKEVDDGRLDPNEALWRLEKGIHTKKDILWLCQEVRKWRQAFEDLDDVEQNKIRLKMIRDDPYAKPSEIARAIKDLQEMDKQEKKERKESGADIRPLVVEIPRLDELMRRKNGSPAAANT